MKYVMAISIGPVAHFIAAGRRSRDLWYGSTWLSKTTSTVADFLQNQPGVEELLSPSKKRLEDIANAKSKKHGARLSNKILAVVVPNEGKDPQTFLRDLAAKCRTEAREYLIKQLHDELPKRVNNKILHRGALNKQIDAIHQGDFIEFAAAWAPVLDPENVFGGAVGRACQLRDGIPKLFGHPWFSKMGVARSDLDEGRDTVLWPENRNDGIEIRQARAKLGLIENEELDAIGLLRRISPRIDNENLPALPFPPVTRVAVDAWLEGCAKSAKAAPILDELRSIIKTAQDQRTAQDPRGDDFYIWCTPSDEPEHGKNRFPYEASVLLDGGCDALAKSVHHMLDGQGPWTDIETTLRSVNECVRRLYKIVGTPNPYYAFIEMDGDGIGEHLKSQKATKDYQQCVGDLDAFAQKASIELEQEGTAFYVAADELAAYVPLDKALDVVNKVAKLFASLVQGKTISAGIVFAHARDDLRGVRVAAHEALAKAKEARKNEASEQGFVCLREMPRAGSDRETIGSIVDIRKDMEHLVNAIVDGRLSLRTEQHLRDHQARYQGMTSHGEIPPGVRLAQDAVRKQFKRSGDSDKENLLQTRIDKLASWEHVEQLANELRMASRIANVHALRGNGHE